MERIAIVTDSTADVNDDIVKEFDIKILPLRIIYKDREYLDRVTITPKEVYDNMVNEIPSTSLPSMEDMDNLYGKLHKEGYTHIIAILISSGISGTYNTFNLVSKNHPEIKTCVFDSRSITMGEGAIVEKCGEMLKEGKSFEEIAHELPKIRESLTVYYVVDTLKYLIAGGRIGKVAGTIGQILNIKPIISINKDGVYYTYAKAKGKKQGINRLVEITKNNLDEGPCKVWVMHGGAEEEVKNLYEMVQGLPNITKLSSGEISPVAGVHTGAGLLGIVVMKDK